MDAPYEPTFVLIVHKVERVACPCFLDLFYIFLQRHLYFWSESGRNKLEFLHLSLGLSDHLLDSGFVPPEIHIIYVSKGHSMAMN